MSRALVLLAVLIAAPVASADVIVVDAGGGGDFTTLTAAVAAAVNGDTLLVRPGEYVEPGSVIVDGKGLTILGERPATLGVPDVTVRPGFVVRNLPATRNVAIANLRVIGTSGVPGLEVTPALVLRDNVAHVRVQGCRLQGGNGVDNDHPDGATAVDAANSALVAMVGCSISGGIGQFSPDLGVVSGHGGAGILWSVGQLMLYQTSVDGGRGGGNLVGGWPDGGNGGAGLLHTAGTLFVAGTSFAGGDGGISHFGGDGGAGLVLGPVGLALLMGGSFSNGGFGGWSDVGPDGADGADLVDPSGLVTNLGGTKRSFDISSPVREGWQGSMDLGGGPNDVALVFLSPLFHQLPFPGYQGVLMLFPDTMLGPFLIGPPGSLDVPFTVPPLGPSIEALSVFVQAAYAGPGGTTLGPGRMLTLLDAGF